MNDDRTLFRTGTPIAAGRIAACGSAALLAASLFVSGCGSKDTFAKVNGQVVTKDEYIHALERQTVVVPGGQPTNAERLVLDTLIGNKIILAEAAKANALPSEEDVNRYFELQKKLFEQTVPGKKYEDTMKEQGTTPEEVKSDMRVQLAETALYAKQLKLGEDQVRKAYENARGAIGLPPRAQFRIIVVQPNSPEFQEAKKLLAAPNADFNAVAKQINLTPALKATGGLQAQATPIKSVGANFQSKVEQTAEGKWFGPVPYQVAQNTPTVQAWVKVEKKLPGYTVSFEDAAPLVRRQLVQMQIMQPQNAAVRQAIMGEKLKATFEPTNAEYKSVWDAVKKAAEEAGVGQPGAAGAPGTGVGTVGGIPVGGPAGAPGAAAPITPQTK